MDRSVRYDDELIVQSACASPASSTQRSAAVVTQPHVQHKLDLVKPSSRVPRNLDLASAGSVGRDHLSIAIANDSPAQNVRLVSLSQAPQEDLLTVRSHIDSSVIYNDLSQQSDGASRLSVERPSRWTDSRPTTALVLAADERQRGENILFEQMGLAIESKSPDDVEKAASDKPPAVPKGLVESIISGSIGTLLFAIIYLPFTLAILTQSMIQRRGILPAEHEKELTPGYWRFVQSRDQSFYLDSVS
jgi:hypothetical protein